MGCLRCSDRSRSRWLCRWAVHARLAYELGDGLRRPGTLRPPLLELFGLELDLGLGRVVRADLIDVATVTGRLGARHDDPVEGMFLGPVSGESDLDHRCPLVRARGAPGQRNRPGIPRPRASWGAEPSFFIIFFVCSNCLISRLTSATDVPLPMAIRLRRLALRMRWLRRSCLVMELIIASMRESSASAPASSPPPSTFFMPGI